jgi:hypothetical protein
VPTLTSTGPRIGIRSLTNAAAPDGFGGDSAVPGPVNTYVQYNAAGTFAGSAGATFSPTHLTSLAPGLGGDSTGDLWYLNAAGSFTRLPIGAEGTVLTVVGGLPRWVTSGPTVPPIWDAGGTTWDGGSTTWSE